MKVTFIWEHLASSYKSDVDRIRELKRVLSITIIILKKKNILMHMYYAIKSKTWDGWWRERKRSKNQKWIIYGRLKKSFPVYKSLKSLTLLVKLLNHMAFWNVLYIFLRDFLCMLTKVWKISCRDLFFFLHTYTFFSTLLLSGVFTLWKFNFAD